MVLNDSLLKAISWTLVHSVWQGFVLALFAGLVILLTKKSASTLRYNLFAGLFLAFIIFAGITFNYEFQNENTETITRLNLPIGHYNTIIETPPILMQSDLSSAIINFLNHNANSIVLLWFLIFSIKCFGIFRSLNHVYRIRNYKTQTPPEYWNNKLSELCRRIQLKKPISLLESRLVKVPSVVGFFKPVILIPVGLLSNLPHDQIEAILLHELAHIRRKDYFINLIQSFAEIIFFFNPGLLWLSSLLKEERENCCDDIAIGITQSKSKFVHALVSFEEYNLKQNHLAMGFGSNKNHLLHRAKRIINNNNKSLNAVEKTFLSVSLIMIAVIMIACSNTKINAEDMTTEPKQAHFDALQANLLADIDNANAQKQNAIAMAQDNKVCIKDMQAQIEAKRAAAADDRARIEDDKASVADAQAAIEDRKAYLADKKAYKDRAAFYKDKSQSAAAVTKSVVSDTKTEHSTQIETTTTTTVDGAKKVRIKTGITGENLPDNINVDQLTKNIISDLISSNVIINVKNLSYKLSSMNLIVNGIMQPISIQKKLQAKYVKSKDISICYNYEYNDGVPLPVSNIINK